MRISLVKKLGQFTGGDFITALELYERQQQARRQ